MIFFKVISFALAMKLLTLSCAAPSRSRDGPPLHTPKRVSSMPTINVITTSTSGTSTDNAPCSDNKDITASIPIGYNDKTPPHVTELLDKIFGEVMKTSFDTTKPPNFNNAWSELQQYHGCYPRTDEKRKVWAFKVLYSPSPPHAFNRLVIAFRVGAYAFARQYTGYTTALALTDLGPNDGSMKDFPYWGFDGTKLEAWDGKSLKEVSATASGGNTLKVEGKASGGETSKVEATASGGGTLKVAEPETVKKRKSTGILRYLGI